MKFDVIIIGKGPAGISCAIYLKRYGYEPLVIAKDGGALEKVSTIENYYGILKISGKELLQKSEEQATKLGIPVVQEEVVSIEKMTDFEVVTNEHTYYSSKVVLACGTSRSRFPMADQLSHVSYCATCDGFFYRQKKVALIGNGSYMAHEYQVLKKLCKEVVVFTNGLPLTIELEDATIHLEPIQKILGENQAEAIVTTKDTIPVDGIFIAIGTASGFTLAKHLGLALEGNALKVNQDYMTNLEGLYACGDVIGGLLQVSKAVSDGACCATAIAKSLKQS